jgi:hypothetical protein
MSWKPQVKTGTDPKWYGNALAFATEKEAQYSADELASRWMLVTATGTLESDEPVNYRIDFDTHTLVAV